MTYRILREQLILKLGGTCVKCGCLHPPVWHIDHKNNDGATERKNLSQQAILKKALKDSTVYQLLCPECHRAKTRATALPSRIRPDARAQWLARHGLQHFANGRER
jgi:hypothetical protein